MRITRWILDHAGFTLLLCLIATVLFGYYARQVEKDNRMDHWMPKSNPVRHYYADEFREMFNLHETIVIGVIHETGDVLNPVTLEKIKRITDKLDEMTLLQDVISLQNVEYISGSDGLLEIEPLYAKVPKSEAKIERLREMIKANEMIYGRLISRDFKGTLILAEPTFDISDAAESAECFRQIKEIIGPEQGPEQIVFAGFPANMSVANRMMNEDLSLLIPMVLAVIMLLLFIFYRSIRGVLLPISIVVTSMAAMFGLMAVLGVKISIIGTSLPVALAAISIADGIHILAEYYHLISIHGDRRRAVELTMEHMNVPVIMTSLTTMGGFLSLATSNLSVVREYGYFMSFGVLMAMIYSLTIIPAALVLLPLPKKIHSSAERDSSLLTRVSLSLGGFSIAHRRITLALMAVFLVATAYGTSQVGVWQDSVGDFKEGTELREADRLINEYITGTATLWIVVHSGVENGAKDPEFLAKVEELQHYIASLEGVAAASSLVDYIKRMNYVLHDESPEYNRLPKKEEHDIVTDPYTGETTAVVTPGSNLIGQLMFLYETSGQFVEKLITSDYSTVNISSTLLVKRTSEFQVITDQINKKATEIFGDEIQIESTGMVEILKEVVHLVVGGQIMSIITSFLGVMIMLSIVFRSVLIGFIGMTPLFFAILANFTVMAIFDIPLNIGTSLIAGIGIGIGVDYAVHVIARYRTIIREEGDPDKAIRATLATTGRAVILNALAVALGHMVLLFSNFMPIIYIGLLVGFTMLASAFGALTILLTVLRVSKYR